MFLQIHIGELLQRGSPLGVCNLCPALLPEMHSLQQNPSAEGLPHMRLQTQSRGDPYGSFHPPHFQVHLRKSLTGDFPTSQHRECICKQIFPETGDVCTCPWRVMSWAVTYRSTADHTPSTKSVSSLSGRSWERNTNPISKATTTTEKATSAL